MQGLKILKEMITRKDYFRVLEEIPDQLFSNILWIEPV